MALMLPPDGIAMCIRHLEHFAFVVHGLPKGVYLAIDLHEDLVEMPTVLDTRAHAIGPSLADLGREHRAKTISPEPNGLRADLYAAFVKKVLDVPQRKRLANVGGQPAQGGGRAIA